MYVHTRNVIFFVGRLEMRACTLATVSFDGHAEDAVMTKFVSSSTTDCIIASPRDTIRTMKLAVMENRTKNGGQQMA